MGFIKERKDVRGLIASFATVVSALEFLGRHWNPHDGIWKFDLY